MSAAPAGGKIEFSPHRELAHLRQDLAVTREILTIVKEENERLCSVAEARTVEVARLNAELQEAKRLLQDQSHAHEVELARFQSGQAALEEELAESIAERKRLSELLHSVRGQVDGRLTALVEELQRQGEAVHGLSYRNKEYEREIERLNRTVKTDSSMAAELEEVQARYSKASAEVVRLQQQVAQYQLELSSTREKMQQPSDNSVDAPQKVLLREAVSLLTLYRQWLLEVRAALWEIEDRIETSLNDGIDSLAHMTTPGVPYRPPTVERERLQAMKKFERERRRVDPTVYPDRCETCEDSFAFSVRAIRDAWDASKHSLEKVKVLSSQLSETLRSVVQVSEDLHTKTTPPPPSGSETGTKAAWSKCDQSRIADSLRENFELQLQFRDEEQRKRDAEVANLKSIISTLEEQKDLLSSELLKGKQEAVNASLSSALKLNELECKLRETVSSGEAMTAKALSTMQLEQDKERKELTEANSQLKKTLEEERASMEDMKRLLVESKRRRIKLKDENRNLRKQLQTTEDLLSALRLELLEAKQSMELLHAELHFAERSQERPTSSSHSKTFLAFKNGIQKSPFEAKAVYLPRAP
ncbi:uncharacterized protein Tco025E_08209 [Trypanosoma conorhini]|uniref:Uncharacterized protein n=1 Tax=Trypanosoma conorhini TaxID=83891 RepID=A0A422NFH2_9TRYP|nr:uncharacterized protein Tco025E_08209 [Trypanosoma conorhini]RNF04222.1 hypothetical protein Tco025E_08209 [Trypanosoma conorhini]